MRLRHSCDPIRDLGHIALLMDLQILAIRYPVYSGISGRLGITFASLLLLYAWERRRTHSESVSRCSIYLAVHMPSPPRFVRPVRTAWTVLRSIVNEY